MSIFSKAHSETLNEIATLLKKVIEDIDKPCRNCSSGKTFVVYNPDTGRCPECGDMAVPFVRKPEPELIQGYTAEQWDEIIDGGYLVEFPDGYDNWCLCSLKNVDCMTPSAQVTFECVHGYEYTKCRPAQIKGVMRPIWVEPVDGRSWCIFKPFRVSDNGLYAPWDSIAAKMVRKNSETTSYIEV